MSPYEIVATVFGAAGLIGGVIGFIVALAARKKAGESETVANAARTQSALALERSAAANERVVEVWERMAAKPVPRPEFVAGIIADRTLGWLTNRGAIGARNLTINGLPEPAKNLVSFGAATPIALPPGQTVQFNVDERLALRVEQIEIVWYDDRNPDVPQTETHWLSEG